MDLQDDSGGSFLIGFYEPPTPPHLPPRPSRTDLLTGHCCQGGAEQEGRPPGRRPRAAARWPGPLRSRRLSNCNPIETRFSASRHKLDRRSKGEVVLPLGKQRSPDNRLLLSFHLLLLFLRLRSPLIVFHLLLLFLYHRDAPSFIVAPWRPRRTPLVWKNLFLQMQRQSLSVKFLELQRADASFFSSCVYHLLQNHPINDGNKKTKL